MSSTIKSSGYAEDHDAENGVRNGEELWGAIFGFIVGIGGRHCLGDKL
jgi:hypothetical protein